jgi:hypothetical protein
VGLIDAFIVAKWRRIEVSRAMHEPLSDLRGAEPVRAAAIRAAGCIAIILRSCSNVSFRDEHLLSLLIVMACSSPDRHQSLYIQILPRVGHEGVVQRHAILSGADDLDQLVLGDGVTGLAA